MTWLCCHVPGCKDRHAERMTQDLSPDRCVQNLLQEPGLASHVAASDNIPGSCMKRAIVCISTSQWLSMCIIL